MSPILVAGNGQEKILTPDELRRLFSSGLRSNRDHAMLGICLFTGCRVYEALTLQTTDIKGETLTSRKSTTVRQAENARRRYPAWSGCTTGRISTQARSIVSREAGSFSPTLTRFAADKILRDACFRVGIVGVSTHS